MNEETKREVESYLESFGQKVWRNFEQAYKSGAIDPDNDEPIVIMKSVLKITAEEIEFRNPTSKRIYKNLRHFV